MKKHLFLVSVCLVIVTNCFAQRNSIWLGAGGAINYNSITLTGDFNVQTGRHFYLTLLTDMNGSYSNYVAAGTGLGAGYIYKRRSLLLALSTGATIDMINNFSRNEVTGGIGLPLKLQIYTTTKWIGLGLNGFLKFNSFQNYGGVGLVVGLGKMR